MENNLTKILFLLSGVLLVVLLGIFALLYQKNYNNLKSDYLAAQSRQVSEELPRGDTYVDQTEPNFKKDAWNLTIGEINQKIRNLTTKITPQQNQSATTDQLPQDPYMRSIAKLAPFSIDFMTVIYYPSDQSFRAIITKSPFDVNKNTALSWFRDHQVKNLCEMKLEFDAESTVKPRGSLTQEERSTPGCPPIPQT